MPLFRTCAAMGLALLGHQSTHAREVSAVPGFEVDAAQFGAIPDDGQNDAEALRKALDHVRSRPGSVLRLAPGTYNFRDEQAVTLMEQAMAGQFGINPQPSLFRPYFPYAKGLDLGGAHGLVIEARGAQLLFEGWGEPVSIKQAKDVTIRGLTIDYKRRGWSAGPVTALGADWFEAEIDAASPVTEKMPLPRILFWDRDTQRMVLESEPARIEMLGPQRVRVHTRQPLGGAVRAGMAVGLMHSFHFRPAVLIQESDNVRLEGVTIHSQPGMGVVGHRCSNVTFSGLRVTPPPGQSFSTATDATHLTSCTGLIRYENSLFEGHGDDAINIHNYYWVVTRGKKGGFVLTLPTETHAAVLDHPDVGDLLEVVRANTLEPIGSVRVTAVAPHPETMQVEVELEGDLPGDLKQVYLSDVTRLPKVEVIGNQFLSHRARGTLIKTHNVLIERNLFMGMTGTAIHIAAEGGWYEGVPSANVTIRDNRFIANGFGEGSINRTSAIAVNIDAREQPSRPLHRGLVIEGNLIDGGGMEKCIWISQARDVAIRHNEISGCKLPIVTERSEAVTIGQNQTAP